MTAPSPQPIHNPPHQLPDADEAVGQFAVFAGRDLSVIGRVIAATEEAAAKILHRQPAVMLVIDGATVTGTITITASLSGEGAQ